MNGDHGVVVRFRRVSPTHHRFEVVRGGASEAAELETRSTLLHDLVHFAVESEAGLRDSFYGRLARGVAYAALAAPEMAVAMSGEIAATERVVAALQGAWKRGLAPAAFVATLRDYFRNLGEPAPEWLTPGLIERAASRLRELEGAWRATQFGDPLELRFPADGSARRAQ